MLVLALLVLLAASPADRAEMARHSGLIIGVDPARGALTLDGIGPWHPGTGDVRRVLGLTPLTRVVLVSRATGRARDGWSGGFDESPLTASDLRVGDYSNVTVAKRDGRLVAISITVVRPGQPARSGPASPGPTGSATGERRHVG